MIKNKVRFAFIGIFFVFLMINSVYAITGSMGNARMILYPEVGGWFTTTIEKSILTKNVNDEDIKITLEASEEGKEFLEVIDEEFILGPGEEKNAEFLVKVRKEGRYEGKINVFFSPVEGNAPGVALSSTIIVIAKKDQGYKEVEEEKEEENNTVNVITGGSVGIKENNKLNGTMLLGISSVVLLIVLLVLLVLMSKKEKKK